MDESTADTTRTGTATGGWRLTKWRALGLVSVAELLAMSLWFSATAVAPEIAAAWGLTPGETGLLTSAVQVGFVVGALLSAALTLSDAVPPRYLVAAAPAVFMAVTVYKLFRGGPLP